MSRERLRHLPRALTAVAFTATVIAAIGCGAGDDSFHGSPTRTAQALAYADAVNLRAGDLPGLGRGQAPAKPEITRRPFASVMEKCDLTPVVAGKLIGFRSPHFGREAADFTASEQLSSVVYVMESATFASRELALLRNARVTTCAKRFFETESARVAREETSGNERRPYTHVAAAPLTSGPLPGVSTFGLRLTASVADPGTGGRVRFYEDSLGFVVGPALILLATDGFKPHGLPSAVERHLLAVLYQRAAAHKL